MPIQLEQSENLICLLPGVHQMDIKSMFQNAVLGVGKEEIVVYHDQTPDSSNSGTYFYKIRAKVQYSDVLVMLIENLKGVKGLLFNKKITFVTPNQDMSLVFYINKHQEKYLKPVLKQMKLKKIRVEKRKKIIEL